MSLHRPHITGERSSIWRREVVCGGNPQLALVRALETLPGSRDHVWSFGVGHDDGCPALAEGMARCTSELVWLEARQAA